MLNKINYFGGSSPKAGVTTAIGIFCLTLITSCRPSALPNQSSGERVSADDVENQRSPLLEGWSEPRAVLVFSGDEHGYLEPCGCTERQTGGFALRADLIRQIKEERSWPLTAFDVGGILNEKRVTYPQSKIKFNQMLQGFNQMGYQGIALGLEELLLGPDALYSQHANSSATEGYDVPFLAANVTIFGTKDLGTPINSRLVEVGDSKVGVIGIVGNTTRNKIAQTGLTADENQLKIDSPEDVLRTTIDELQKQSPDLLILLSHSEIDESEGLAKQFPEFQIVVTAGSAEDPLGKPSFVGETMIVHVGKKGKNVAAVGLFADGELKHELIELDKGRFKPHPEMIELMQSYQNDLQDHFSELVSDDLAIAHVTGGTFAGSKSCVECHKFAYGIWSKTKHAGAFQSLIEGHTEKDHTGKEQTAKGHADKKYSEENEKWISRIWDPECLCCHTTGWEPQTALRYQSGFKNMESTPLLAGQQCENCHGPAAEHVILEKSWKKNGGQLTSELIETRKSLQLLKAEAEQKVCARCHDHDNSPKFEFEKYWKEVNHSGRKD